MINNGDMNEDLDEFENEDDETPVKIGVLKEKRNEDINKKAN